MITTAFIIGVILGYAACVAPAVVDQAGKMSGRDESIASQAEAWLIKLIERKLDAGEELLAYEMAVDSEVEAQSMRDFGYSRGPCKPRMPRR